MAHFELVEKMAPNAVIKVVGVGGGGGNAVAHMVNSSVDGVEFITANTDSQAIKNCGAKLQLQLGSNVTKGLGAGANPEVGRQAALEDRERIVEALEGADMVFITAGMGGGTGTGAAPVIARVATRPSARRPPRRAVTTSSPPSTAPTWSSSPPAWAAAPAPAQPRWSRSWPRSAASSPSPWSPSRSRSKAAAACRSR